MVQFFNVTLKYANISKECTTANNCGVGSYKLEVLWILEEWYIYADAYHSIVYWPN